MPKRWQKKMIFLMRNNLCKRYRTSNRRLSKHQRRMSSKHLRMTSSILFLSLRRARYTLSKKLLKRKSSLLRKSTSHLFCPWPLKSNRITLWTTDSFSGGRMEMICLSFSWLNFRSILERQRSYLLQICQDLLSCIWSFKCLTIGNWVS